MVRRSRSIPLPKAASLTNSPPVSLREALRAGLKICERCRLGRFMASILVLTGTIAVQPAICPGVELHSPVGLWQDEDAQFEIYDSHGTLSGRIVSIKSESAAEGKTRTDIHNPDPSKRARPIIGLVMMSGFVRESDTHWDHGTIYDPRNGNTYSCSMDLDGPDTIKVRGYIGISLLGRTETWTRVPGHSQ
jgi:uncharacterized protein (DUF2147 family)